ncbi:MAG: efflux RND transporter permease subunit [Treponema sp.]|nr:efflux RND transporter permease subunit [Treponema sp.]
MIFKSKTKAGFALLCLAFLSVYSLKNLRLSKAPPSECENYAVEFEWFGMDAEKIEKLVAMPFEEKISRLPGLVSASCVCERSKCVASLVFEKSERPSYAAVSAAADELKRSLPQDAQNPRIYALAQESKYVFCAAFDKDLFSHEEISAGLLQELKGIHGVSQALLSGGESKEIHLSFDDKLIDQSKLFPWNLANYVQEGQARAACKQKTAYKSQFETFEDIKANPQVQKSCQVAEAFQKKESLVRVNGKECLLLSLKSSEENHNLAVSKKARALFRKALKSREGWKIVYDNGMEQEKALKKILAAFFETLAALAAAVWLVFRSARKTMTALAFTALDTLFTAAAFSALGIPLDSATISGLTISLGLMCDAALYVLDDCKSSSAALLIPSLTTIAAIAPLLSLNAIVPGIKSLGQACVLSIGLSSAMALVFLPPFVFNQKTDPKESFGHKNFLNLYILSDKTNKKILNLSKILYILPALLFFFIPKNLKSADSETVIFAQVEFNPEKRFDLVDKSLGPFLERIQKIKGIKFVQSEAKRGRAELQIVLDSPRRKDKVCELLREEGKGLAASLYVPLEPPKRKIVQKMQIAVLGDDSALCKKIAQDAAGILQEDDFVAKNKGQVVLNFKEDETVFLAKPNKDFLRQNGLSVQDLAHFLRWNVFGPVVAKLWAGGRQKDIRLGNESMAFEAAASIEGVKSLVVKKIPVSALCGFEKAKRPSKIFREDFKRAAYFTLEVQTKNSGKAFERAKSSLKKLNLPEGYYFSWPKEYESMDENYAKIFASFLLGAAAIFFLVCAQCQKIWQALCILATIPLSLLAPLLLRSLAFCPLTLGDAVGMVFISGLCVNNALYILSEYKNRGDKNPFRAAKSLSKSVLSSSATTLVASVPVMICGGGGFASDLAFFMFFGTLASVFAGLVYFPAALDAQAKIERRKKNAPTKCQGAVGRKDCPVKPGNDSFYA